MWILLPTVSMSSITQVFPGERLDYVDIRGCSHNVENANNVACVHCAKPVTNAGGGDYNKSAENAENANCVDYVGLVVAVANGGCGNNSNNAHVVHNERNTHNVDNVDNVDDVGCMGSTPNSSDAEL